MLQSMRSAAKYVWIFIAVAFIGGFLFAQASGLLGRAPVTTSTAVAEVNGEKILYTDWQRAVQARNQQANQQAGRALTLDEQTRVEQQVFDDMVNEAAPASGVRAPRHLGQRRGDHRSCTHPAAPELANSAELQTEGRFDPAKYQRYLSNPAAREGGLLAYLEQYYRQEIPRQKLFAQVASDVYVSDGRLWSIWQDSHDSAQVTYAALRAESIADSAVQVSDGEISSYYGANKKQFERPGRAVLSLLTHLPLAHVCGLGGVARARRARARARSSAGRSSRTWRAASRRTRSRRSRVATSGAALADGSSPSSRRPHTRSPIGDVSQPVLSQFGYHLIRVDSKKGDTLSVRHILIPIQQSDSNSARSDRLADDVAKIAASQEDPKKFDEAVARHRLSRATVVAIEGEPVSWLGKPVPSVSAWAFTGARPGETSDLYDAPDAYYLARLDSLTEGGQQPLSEVRDEIRQRLAQEKKVEQLLPRGQQLRASGRAQLARGGGDGRRAEDAVDGDVHAGVAGAGPRTVHAGGRRGVRRASGLDHPRDPVARRSLRAARGSARERRQGRVGGAEGGAASAGDAGASSATCARLPRRSARAREDRRQPQGGAGIGAAAGGELTASPAPRGNARSPGVSSQ